MVAVVNAILVEGLVKRYGQGSNSHLALDGLDLEIEEGTALGLLGPNGAGKTTTVRILTTLLRPDAGRVEVAGIDVLRDPAAVRRRIGLAGQFTALDYTLTAPGEPADVRPALPAGPPAGRPSGRTSCWSASG